MTETTNNSTITLEDIDNNPNDFEVFDGEAWRSYTGIPADFCLPELVELKGYSPTIDEEGEEDEVFYDFILLVFKGYPDGNELHEIIRKKQ